MSLEEIERPKFSNDNLLKAVSLQIQSNNSINTQQSEDKISEVSEKEEEEGKKSISIIHENKNEQVYSDYWQNVKGKSNENNSFQI